MFDRFQSRDIATTGTRIYLRIGGEGPPLLLLHGYPETGAMWHKIAPALARDFTVVIPDLRGYGRSGKPDSAPGHEPHSKRAMALDMVEVMGALGHERFALAGHDRGGRVSYRLALDHPGVLTRLAVLDIVPTLDTWEAMGMRQAMGSYHWLFLAQPARLPETLIGHDPLFYLDETLGRWTRDKASFTPEALAEYQAAFNDPATIHACCEDYRAGATIDLELDRADRAAGRRITCPMLVLWGDRGRPGEGSQLETWRGWAGDVRGQTVPGGHFLPEESPSETLAALQSFFREP
ncbi:MAG: alpha/beta hydrolase [Chloroflexi bacterium]|nr:alpha/beta hydrolase [Chloroflexota bacterium]